MTTSPDSLTNPEGAVAPKLSSQPWFPWVAAGCASVIVWVTESLLHAYYFTPGNFLGALLSPAPHEFWMRFLVTVLVGVIVAGWSSAIREHRRNDERLLAYQAQLREVTVRLAHGQNEAYRALADRLHEDVAQSLAAGRLFLSTAESDDEPIDPRVTREVSRILDRAIVDCRQIAKEISPPSLETYGLITALEAMATQVMMRSGVSVEISGEELPEIPRQLLLAAYQALAEIVAVAASNPDTSTIRIAAESVDDMVDVRVSWDAEDPSDLLLSESAFKVLGGDVTRNASAGATVVVLHTPPMSAA